MIRGLILAGLFAGVLAAGAGPANPPAPSAEEIERSIRRGLEFILKDQNKDGSWGSARRTKELNIYAPVPGAHQAFRSAVTAMCVAALIETGAAQPEAKQALERGQAWLLEHLPNLRRANTIAIYNVWAHIYGVHALADMYAKIRDPEVRDRIESAVQSQIDLLERYESVDGGWGYYDFRVGSQRPASDSTSFVTASALIAFDRARKAGLPFPEDVVERGLASIRRQQKQDYSYLYGEYLKYRPMLPINRPGGSLGRSQACNLALRLWGDTNITEKILGDWLERLIVRNDWLSFGRKRPIPHESWFQVAGYFFYYGHYYAMLCADELTGERAAQYRERLAAILLGLQEKDGSWWDYPLYNYHQQYGTAFALMSLARCR